MITEENKLLLHHNSQNKIAMKIYLIVCLFCITLFSSCESCVQKAAKKDTDLSLSALEGVSESISEHGQTTSEKMTDALGSILKGSGKSIERQLNEHAAHVASVGGRTFVQAIDGLGEGVTTEYYEPVNSVTDLSSGVALQYFGKIKTNPVLDAYFIVVEKGNYSCEFDFLDPLENSILKRTATIEKINTEGRISVVSLALNDEELNKFTQTKTVNIKIRPQK